MIVITGATGQTGHIAAKTLLERGQKVRVLGRSAAKLAPLAALGAEALAFDIHDEAALTKAFTGADAVYALNPPDITNEDVIGHYDRNSEALVAAIKGSGVKHVVALSSIGAQLPEGSGPILGLHRMEEKLNTIRHLNVLHLRPAYFMENTLAQIPVIQKFGAVGGIIKGDVKFPMIATKDIGVVAAEKLERRDIDARTSGPARHFDERSRKNNRRRDRQARTFLHGSARSDVRHGTPPSRPVGQHGGIDRGDVPQRQHGRPQGRRAALGAK